MDGELFVIQSITPFLKSDVLFPECHRSRGDLALCRFVLCVINPKVGDQFKDF